jgi:hypothetical protein
MVKVRPVMSERGDVWPVVQLLHPFQDAFPRLLCNIRVIAQNFGDGHDRKTQILCNILQPRNHFSLASLIRSVSDRRQPEL